MRTVFALCLILCMGVTQASASESYQGIIAPVHEVGLAMDIDGVVVKRFVREGDFVKTGARLLKLDDTLQKLETDRRREIYNDASEIESNKENLAIIKSLLDTARRLHETTASVSGDEVKNLEMQYHNLRGKVNVAEAKKKQERIEYEISKAVLTRYELTSPIDGMVTVIKPESGEWARAGEVLAVVVNTSSCFVDFNIAQPHARKLKKGDPVTIDVDDGQGLAARKGAVVFVSSVADRESGLVKVKVEFENKSGKVIPGGLATIHFE